MWQDETFAEEYAHFYAAPTNASDLEGARPGFALTATLGDTVLESEMEGLRASLQQLSAQAHGGDEHAASDAPGARQAPELSGWNPSSGSGRQGAEDRGLATGYEQEADEGIGERVRAMLAARALRGQGGLGEEKEGGIAAWNTGYPLVRCCTLTLVAFGVVVARGGE